MATATAAVAPAAAPGAGTRSAAAPATVPAGGWERRRLLSRRHLRIALGCLWLLDAALQLEPSNFARGYPLTDLAQSVMGGPPWENHLVFSALGPFVSHWPWWNLASALLQATIGACLVLGRGTRLALAVSFGWVAMVWLVGEGLGMLPTGFATMLTGAPGGVLLYGVIGALAWPRRGIRDVDRRWWAAAWTVLWAGAACLQLPLVYPTGQVLQANFAESSAGQRSLLVHLSDAAARVAAHDPVAFSAALGVLQLAVAAGWLADRAHPRRWLGLGIGLSLVYWVVGQCLGGILSPGATDPGLGPLVVLLALAAWPCPPPRSTRLGEERLQHRPGSIEGAPLDPLVGVMGEQRVTGAEVGRRDPVGPERRHVGPADLGPRRFAGAGDQRRQ